MCHKNKNEILDFYYNLDEPKKRVKTQKHLENCQECNDYLNTLINTGEILDTLPNELPNDNSLTAIFKKIDSVQQLKPAPKKSALEIPVLKIAITILFILLGIYFLQSKFELSSFWGIVENTWLVQTFGKYSFIFAAFFVIGSLITLALAPILYLQSEKGKKLIIK